MPQLTFILELILVIAKMALINDKQTLLIFFAVDDCLDGQLKSAMRWRIQKNHVRELRLVAVIQLLFIRSHTEFGSCTVFSN